MLSIESDIAAVLSRSGLPVRVRVVRAHGPVRPGQFLSWDESSRGYRAPSGHIVRAGFIRRAWGVFFEAAPEQLRLAI